MSKLYTIVKSLTNLANLTNLTSLNNLRKIATLLQPKLRSPEEDLKAVYDMYEYVNKTDTLTGTESDFFIKITIVWAVLLYFLFM